MSHLRIPSCSFQRISCSIRSKRIAPGRSSLLSKDTDRDGQSSRSYASGSGSSEVPKTFSRQSSLPRLPVPDLEKSLEGYLKSLQPVMEQRYKSSELQHEMEKRRLYAKDFAAPGGLGRRLQERLLDLEHMSVYNWLAPTLWINLAYHTWRAPLLVNSNWGILFAPDSSSTKDDDLNPNPSSSVPADSQGGGDAWLKENQKIIRGPTWDEAVKREDVTPWQIRRAAWLIRRYAEFREKVAKEKLSPDTTRKGEPLCMHQYTRLFNFSRIPYPGSDTFSAQVPQALHATIMVDDFIYSIDVFARPESNESTPTPLPVADIEKRLQAVVSDAKSRKSNGEQATSVGILTGDERDTWTLNREKLLMLSASNRHSLESISNSLLSLSLDPYTLPSLPSDDPLKLPYVDAQLHNSFVGSDGGRNRWYDKPINLIVETDGRASICGEHSAADAVYHTTAIDYVLEKPVDEAEFKETTSSTKGWERVDWTVDKSMKHEITECQKRNKKIMADTDASQLWWKEYGAEWIKENAKVSPDAYIQQALQLTYFKDQGYATATYETASTRRMLHGRTETVRTLSTESRSFVKGMLDTTIDDKKRLQLLKQACEAHKTLTKRSASGHGYDRHLMGLKVVLRDDETHQLFEDEMYSKSQEFRLSSSGLTAGTNLMGGQFGSAWPDGYSVSYFAGPYMIKCGVESKWSCDKTSSDKFKHHLAQSLRDMRRLVESTKTS